MKRPLSIKFNTWFVSKRNLVWGLPEGSEQLNNVLKTGNTQFCPQRCDMGHWKAAAGIPAASVAAVLYSQGIKHKSMNCYITLSLEDCREPDCQRWNEEIFLCRKKCTVIYLALPSTGRDTEATTTISSCTRQEWHVNLKVGVGRQIIGYGGKNK